MPILKFDCPHCLVKDLAMTIHVALPIRGRSNAVALMTCPRCDLPIGAYFSPSLGQSPSMTVLTKGNGDPTLDGWEVSRSWPEAKGPDIPGRLPDEIVRAYLQAERNFEISGNEEAAGIMYGKSLDIAVRKIDPDLKGMLGHKIDQLTKQGKLTRELCEWAHEIRLLRNDAAHEEVAIDRDDLVDLRHFTEMVLRYLFTLPAMVAERRSKRGH